MICERCGHTIQRGELTCENCGTFVGKGFVSSYEDTGVRAIRQGRMSAGGTTIHSSGKKGDIKEYGDYDLSAVPLEYADNDYRQGAAAQMTDRRSGSSRADMRRRGVPVNARGRAPSMPRKSGKVRSIYKKGFNWMKFFLVIVCIAIASVVGYLVYMSQTDEGQRATARKNILSSSEELLEFAAMSDDPTDPEGNEEREELLKKWNSAGTASYWLVGQEYLDVGDIDTAILAFKMADLLDPENYDGLLMLASAYELNNDDASAEQVYLKLAHDISPFRTESYTALIRIYQEQERRPEAADMMKLAYKETDKENFRLQRKDYIPLTPQVDLPAGRYEMEQPVAITSPQGYDIYYTSDPEAVLPDDGTLMTTPSITLHEGSVTLRAVCVSGDLVSDPMSVTYTIFYPTPPAPKCNLAPNTYQNPKQISLRAGEGAEKEELTFYYTIDGSMPDRDSPIYDGTPIQMPTGRVILRAVCVNQYGKMSSTMEVGYKFTAKPYPLDEYSDADCFVGFKLNTTTPMEFEERFGAAKEQITTKYLNMDGEARHLNYPWGYAVFVLESNKWQLVRIEMTSPISDQPRGVGIGSTEDEIIAVYKDFGQLTAPNGKRSMYYNYPAMGYSEPNEDGGRTVTYKCMTKESDSWTIEYYIGKNGRCEKIAHYFLP